MNNQWRVEAYEDDRVHLSCPQCFASMWVGEGLTGMLRCNKPDCTFEGEVPVALSPAAFEPVYLSRDIRSSGDMLYAGDLVADSLLISVGNTHIDAAIGLLVEDNCQALIHIVVEEGAV